MWATYALVALSAFCGGWLVGHRRRFKCVICYRPLSPVCPDGRCGGTPGGEVR